MKMLFHLLPALLLLGSCTKTGDYETELMQLGREEKALQCTLDSLHSRISTEWDGVNALLKANLPQDMPEEEKANMLRVRNAGLIRMFESFQSVDPAIKQALAAVEQTDVNMRKEILVLKAQAQQVEAHKMALYEKISRTAGAAALASYQKRYSDILRETCN